MAAGDALVEPRAPIRVLIANLEGVLPETVVQMVAQQSDMVLVGSAQSQIELLLAVEESIDVLVLSAQRAAPLPAICGHLLGEYPDLRILVIADGGKAAALYWMGLRQRRLREASPVALLEGIRNVYRINPTT